MPSYRTEKRFFFLSKHTIPTEAPHLPSGTRGSQAPPRQRHERADDEDRDPCLRVARREDRHLKESRQDKKPTRAQIVFVNVAKVIKTSISVSRLSSFSAVTKQSCSTNVTFIFCSELLKRYTRQAYTTKNLWRCPEVSLQSFAFVAKI